MSLDNRQIISSEVEKSEDAFANPSDRQRWKNQIAFELSMQVLHICEFSEVYEKSILKNIVTRRDKAEALITQFKKLRNLFFN